MPTGRRSSCSQGFLRNVSGLAGNTHSIFCDGWKQLDTANGCLVPRYTQQPRREAQPRSDEQAEERNRRSPERSRKSSPNLTKTYHGCRLLVHLLTAVKPVRTAGFSATWITSGLPIAFGAIAVREANRCEEYRQAGLHIEITCPPRRLCSTSHPFAQ